MSNQLVSRAYTTQERRLFDLYVGRRNIARVDISSRRWQHANGFVSVTQRRHAVRWYWHLNKNIGKGESISSEESVSVLREMEVNVDEFIAAAKAMGWDGLA